MNKGEKGNIEMGRRGRDTILPSNIPFPHMVIHNRERSQKYTFFLKQQEVCVPPQASQPLDPAQERQAPKMPGFENQQGLHPEKP